MGHMASDPRVLRVSRSLEIPLAELEWSFSASGGPGGQHANTANTRAEVRFDIAGSPTLTAEQRARLQRRLGDQVRVVVADERSQARNRAIALDRLAEKLHAGLRTPKRRVPTQPGRGAKRRRLEAKTKRGQIKRMRGRVDPGD